MPVEYKAFQDDDLVLPKPSGDIDAALNFATPDVDTTKIAVLSFEANPDGNPTLELSLNENQIFTSTFGTDATRVVQEIFSGSILLPSNTLKVRVTGVGSVKTSEYVVMYKSN